MLLPLKLKIRSVAISPDHRRDAKPAMISAFPLSDFAQLLSHR
jgi:hypothetical protein